MAGNDRGVRLGRTNRQAACHPVEHPGQVIKIVSGSRHGVFANRLRLDRTTGGPRQQFKDECQAQRPARGLAMPTCRQSAGVPREPHGVLAHLVEQGARGSV